MLVIVNISVKVILRGYTKTITSVDVVSIRGLYVEEGKQIKAPYHRICAGSLDIAQARKSK